jgi:mannose/cellobiose epimerase-like protein (N-acyl-D-glucosamine 2-epimerase family)
MWVPPTETLPGHQLTWARIMCVLVRMKANVARKAQRKRKAGSLCASTMYVSNALPRLAVVVTIRG